MKNTTKVVLTSGQPVFTFHAYTISKLLMRKYIATLLFSLVFTTAFPQTPEDSIAPFLPDRYLDVIRTKTTFLKRKLEKHTKRSLKKYLRIERRILERSGKSDSSVFARFPMNDTGKFTDIREKLKNLKSPTSYIPGLDTLFTSLKFLQTSPGFLKHEKEADKILTELTGKVNELKSGFHIADEFQKYLKAEKEKIRSILENAGLIGKFADVDHLNSLDIDQSFTTIPSTGHPGCLIS